MSSGRPGLGHQFVQQCLRHQSAVSQPKHKPLSRLQSTFVEGVHFRHAGYSAEGEKLSEEEMHRDAEAIWRLHDLLVVSKEKLAAQMEAFREALDRTGERGSRENLTEFMAAGGHMELPDSQSIIADLCRDNSRDPSYAFLIEWVQGKTVIPVGFNFGYLATPGSLTETVPGKPERHAGSLTPMIAGPNSGLLDTNRATTLVSWRIGLILGSIQDLIQTLRIPIDPEANLTQYNDLSVRRLGFHQLMKWLQGRMAELLDRTLVVANSVSLVPPGCDVIIPQEGGPVQGGMHNTAFRKSNDGLLKYLGPRYGKTPVNAPSGGLIAHAYWDAFGEQPAVLQRKVIAGNGTLDQKLGGDRSLMMRILGGLECSAQGMAKVLRPRLLGREPSRKY